MYLARIVHIVPSVTSGTDNARCRAAAAKNLGTAVAVSWVKWISSRVLCLVVKCIGSAGWGWKVVGIVGAKSGKVCKV